MHGFGYGFEGSPAPEAMNASSEGGLVLLLVARVEGVGCGMQGVPLLLVARV